jgi:dephospho-CoA kinase
VDVGLTGGIGSGKSEVARLLATYGALIVDSDMLAREAVAPGSIGLAAVAAEFGPGILGPDGSLDRPKLAEIVFADQKRREALERIIHPYVRTRAAELAKAAPRGSVVVHDVPLLSEQGHQDRYDVVVVVDAPVEVQLDRLVRLRGMTEADAKARIAAQATRDERLAIADYVIDNSGTLDDLGLQVDRLWRQLSNRADGATGC